MIKHYTSFTYNNIKSGDMGVTHVSLNSGLYEDAIGASRTLVEQISTQSDRRYYKRMSLEPFEFQMHILLNTKMTDAQIESIYAWLLQDYYKELYFENEIDKIYYCMPVSNSTITHNGNGEGYLTLNMRCYDAYLYSREITRSFDLSTNVTAGTNVNLINDGHTDIYPILTILAKEAVINILNLTTNELTQFTGLSVGETVTIDNYNEEISTSVAGVHRYDNHNDIFLRILKPNNNFKVTGKCVLTFRYRYRRKY